MQLYVTFIKAILGDFPNYLHPASLKTQFLESVFTKQSSSIPVFADFQVKKESEKHISFPISILHLIFTQDKYVNINYL